MMENKFKIEAQARIAKGITSSQQLRYAIFEYHRAKKVPTSFEKFYNQEIDSIIQGYISKADAAIDDRNRGKDPNYNQRGLWNSSVS